MAGEGCAELPARRPDFRWMLGNCEDLFGCVVLYDVLIGGGCVYPPPVADSRGLSVQPRRRRGRRKRQGVIFLEWGMGGFERRRKMER